MYLRLRVEHAFSTQRSANLREETEIHWLQSAQLVNFFASNEKCLVKMTTPLLEQAEAKAGQLLLDHKTAVALGELETTCDRSEETFSMAETEEFAHLAEEVIESIGRLRAYTANQMTETRRENMRAGLYPVTGAVEL